VSSFATGYRRSLDLSSAIATTRYVQDGVTFTREAFASPVDDDRSAPGADRAGVELLSRFRDADARAARAEDGDLVLAGGTRRSRECRLLQVRSGCK
jgi:hypothetical protein